MRVLVNCEESGIVRDAFAALGHDAWSCDLQDTAKPGQHIKGSALSVLRDGWDLMIAHPPCTFLASSGIHRNRHTEGRSAETNRAMQFFLELISAPIGKIAIENPVGVVSTRFRKPDQIIQPWMFGHDASKTTCLWLKNLPLLKPTRMLAMRGEVRRANQTLRGDNNLGPSADRQKLRSRTYQGIADAMARQWGGI